MYNEISKCYLITHYHSKLAKGNRDALFKLGLLYELQSLPNLAEIYYLLASSTGNKMALFYLAALYDDLGKYDFAELYYLKTIDENLLVVDSIIL